MPCVSVCYKNNVFYQHIFVTLSFIPAEPGRVGWETKQAHTHTHTHSAVDGIREVGPSSLCLSPTPAQAWMELAILGFLGMLWFELATLLIAFWNCLSRRLQLSAVLGGNVFV